MVTAAKTCSRCGLDGHNARTCVNGVNKPCVKLFGVNISDPTPFGTPLRKSLSMGNLPSLAVKPAEDEPGYHSDGLTGCKKRRASRKTGKPWTVEEHRTFLAGLKNLGKGDWRGISRKFVTTRTPTQVASHAQKYFIRKNNNNQRKRRASLFDIPLDDSSEGNNTDQAWTVAPPTPETLAEGLAQFNVLNQCRNPSMFPQVFRYASAVPVQMVHPSGIPVPRYIPTGIPPSQAD
ncbi:PREDICTED: transcription factor MYB1R1-like [Tarenaya hassleriana]|uniref:Myb-like n=1 Tax=Tarenaya spinosa TaxID=228870 RepID=T1SFV4_9ROSI|nr:PREDICTED: transcription factor MYB1R1-like [Tarenaya hassleriana]AGT21480.1 myb-like [Tarenaya spinosa]